MLAKPLHPRYTEREWGGCSSVITVVFEGDIIKHIANVITLSRIPIAIAVLIVIPFSTGFWILYCLGSITDIADGLFARKLKQQSVLGAKLDSLADFVFAAVIACIIMMNIELPFWMWACFVLIAILRFVCYGIGFYKYHTFAALHTYLNKAAGALIFAAPLLYVSCGLIATGIILIIIAFASAFEETVMIVKSKTLNRDCKGLFLS